MTFQSRWFLMTGIKCMPFTISGASLIQVVLVMYALSLQTTLLSGVTPGKLWSKFCSGLFFSSSFCLMKNNHGPEVPAALPIQTIVIKSRLSCVFFACFLTWAKPTTRRIPELPSTPVSSKLIWKWDCSLTYSSVGWLNLRWSSQTVSIVRSQQNYCSILIQPHLVIIGYAF
jgi:hypothetical protein